MKLLIALLLISNICFSQSIERAITDIVDSKISAFSYTLDSVVVKQFQTSNNIPITIDTLKIPIGKTALFQISLSGISGSDAGFCVKVVQITNTNGVYSQPNNRDWLGWGGKGVFAQKVEWNIWIVNGLAVIKLTGINSTVNWTLARQTL